MTIPTIKQLYDGYVAAMEAEMQVTLPVFGKSYIRALAAVEAARDKLLYLALGSVKKNVFIDTADPASMGGTLERFGFVKLGRYPYAAKAGQYKLVITGSAGSTIPESTVFKSNDDSLSPSKLFVLDNAFVLTAITDTITVRALEAGIGSRLLSGNKLTATAPIANVDAIAIVDGAAVVEPLAAETTEEYRQKVLDSYQLEPQGGSPGDYRLWASDAKDVKKVYPYDKAGAPNELNVFVEAKSAASIDGKGTPSAALLQEVSDVLEMAPDPNNTMQPWERGRRPLGVFQIHCLPINAIDLDVDIQGLLPNDALTKQGVVQAIKSKIESIRPYVKGTEDPSKINDRIDLNKIALAIYESYPGIELSSISLRINGITQPIKEFTQGDIPFLNSVNFLI